MSDEWVPDRWLDVDADGRPTLLGGWSATSGHHHFPPASICPYSGADDVEVVALPRTGTLWGWTAVTAAPPGYDGPVPFGFGIVELTLPQLDVLRVIGRLTESDPSALRAGQPMEVTVEELPSGHRIWAFAPAEPPLEAGPGGS